MECGRTAGCVTTNQLLGQPNQNIKFYRDRLVVGNGPNLVGMLDLCNLKWPFTRYYQNVIKIPKATTKMALPHALGGGLTFLAIRAKYDIKEKDPNKKYVRWHYKSTPTAIGTISDLLILTGTPEQPISEILFDNPSQKYDVTLEVLAATSAEEIIFADTYCDPKHITGLTWKSIRAEAGVGSDILILKDLVPVLSINNKNILSFEKINRDITINEKNLGPIKLSFISEFDANQALSILNWYWMDLENRFIDGTEAADTTPPAILLVDEDPLPAGTNAVQTLTKQDVIDYYVIQVLDDRDGEILLTPHNVQISQLDTGEIVEEIDVYGSYVVQIAVTDIAQNSAVEVFTLNFRDLEPPKLIVQPWVAGWLNGNTEPNKIYIHEYTLGIGGEELISLFLERLVDKVDTLELNPNYVKIKILSNTNTEINKISEPGIYRIQFLAYDKDQNSTPVLWESENKILVTQQGVPVDYVDFEVLANQPPQVVWATANPTISLYDYNEVGIISKNDLYQTLIVNVEDDITSANDLRLVGTKLIQLQRLTDQGLIPIPEKEVIYISEPGLYRFVVQHMDHTDAIGTNSVNVLVQ